MLEPQVIPMKVNGGETINFAVCVDSSIPMSISTAVNMGGLSEPYEGEYEFTPSSTTQVIQTTDKKLTENIVIKPIPSNYGLITWNGASLTVS